MCRPGLFYFSRNVTEGPPEETCMTSIHTYLVEEGSGLGGMSAFVALIALWCFGAHFFLYCKGGKSGHEDLEKGHNPSHPHESINTYGGPQVDQNQRSQVYQQRDSEGEDKKENSIELEDQANYNAPSPDKQNKVEF